VGTKVTEIPTKPQRKVEKNKTKQNRKLVRQSQIVQSVIYGSDAVVTQVLDPAVLSLGS